MRRYFQPSFGFIGILGILFGLMGCGPVTQTIPPTPTATIQPSPTPTTIPPSRTPRPTARPPAPDMRPVGTFGAGFFSGVFRSPDGQRIFVLMNGKELRWYDATTIQQEGVMALSDYPFSPNEIIFGSDPNLVAVDGYETLVIDLKNQKIITSILGTEEYLSGVQFSSDAKLLFFRRHEIYNHGFADQVAAWDIYQNQLAHFYWQSENSETITNPAISPDGKWIVAGYDNLLQIRNVQTGKLLQSIKGHNNTITSVAFSKDGSQLASVDTDGIVYLWNSYTRQRLASFLLKIKTQVVQLSFSDDGQQVLATFESGDSQAINLQTGQVQAVHAPTIDPFALGLHQQGYSQLDYGDVALTISPDGKTLAVGSGAILLWNIQTHNLSGVLESPHIFTMWEMQFDPTGRLLAGITDYETLLWDTTATTQPNLAKALGPANRDLRYGLSFSPDGKRLAFGHGTNIEIWDVETSKLVKTLQINSAKNFVYGTQFSADNQSIYVVTDTPASVKDKYGNGVIIQVQIWNIETSRMTRLIEIPSINLSSDTFALHWPFFAFENHDVDKAKDWIEIWDLETGNSKKVNSWLNPKIFSENSDLLFGISALGENFCVWQVDAGKLVYTSPELGEDPTHLKYNLDSLQPSNFVAVHGYHNGIVQLFDISAILDYARQP